MRRAGVEKRFAPRKLEARGRGRRFDVYPTKPELVRFLNEYGGE